MFYKYWKNFALTLTALFWASCENTTTASDPLYGCPPDVCSEGAESSSDANTSSSSSTETSSATAKSSDATAESSSSIKDLLSSSSIAVVYGPMTVNCYNDSAVNDSGTVFKTITCDNGQKYLRFQGLYMDLPETQKNLPKGVGIVPPDPKNGIAVNCTVDATICIDGVKEDENGNLSPVGGCYPAIECPAKAEESITCTPTDSSVSYFSDEYSADIKKMWKEEAAKHDAADKIDSIKQTLTETPTCLENLREELSRFMALYGAPTIIKNAVEVCSNGSTRPSEEYAKFLKMQEEWEANKPALEKELQKVYEDKLKEIEQRINKCLNGSNDGGDK